ncbi:MAG: GNAT family N-acetyltransferase [Christensenellales bacterium]|jgi:predicted GNAT family N-acyltransferase
MILGKWVNGTGEGFDTALAIRTEVFCEELGVSLEEERDEFDKISAHVLIFDENSAPVATGRLFPDREGWHIGRLCVKKQSRGKGFGDMALRMLLDRAARTVPDADIVLSARTDVADWYATFGFAPEGEVYDEAGFPHVRMRVNAKNIIWHKPCGGRSS